MNPSASPACPLKAPPPDPSTPQSFFHFGSFTGYEALATAETLHKIVKGETKSPMRLDDWRAFMRREGKGEDGLSSIDLLVEIMQYEEAFAQLPPEKAAKSPPPFEAISQMALLDPTVLEPLRPPPRSFVPGHSPKGSFRSPTISEKASSRYTVIPRTPRLGGLMTFTFGHHDSRPSSTISNDDASLPGSLATGLSRPRPNASRTVRPAGAPGTPLSPPAKSPQTVPQPQPLPNPLIQPLRSALDVLVASIHPTVHGIPIEVLARTQSDSELTTHPELLRPIRQALEDNLLATHLPPFVELSLRNLHRHTALGRLLVGILTGLVALLFTFLLLLNPSPFRPRRLDPVERPFRLLLVPIYLGGVGYALGCKAGMCFWLALFGVREDPSADTTRQSALEALREKWSNRHTRSPSSANGIQPGRKLRKRSASVRSDTIELVASHSTWSSSHLTSVQSRSAAHEDSVWIILWRLTGMAWNVTRVEDPTLLRHHRRASYRIAAYLTFLLAIIAVVLYFLPYIPLRRGPA